MRLVYDQVQFRLNSVEDAHSVCMKIEKIAVDAWIRKFQGQQGSAYGHQNAHYPPPLQAIHRHYPDF